MVILYVRKIEIKIRSFVMFISDIRGALFGQLMFRIIISNHVKMKCKWKSFGPKYLLKMVRYTVKNVIKDLNILLKSSLKMQEMLF